MREEERRGKREVKIYIERKKYRRKKRRKEHRERKEQEREKRKMCEV